MSGVTDALHKSVLDAAQGDRWGYKSCSKRLRDRHEGVVVGRHPHDDVREREVGEQLTVGDEEVQPLDVGRRRPAGCGDELGQCGHAISLKRATDRDGQRERAAIREYEADLREVLAKVTDATMPVAIELAELPLTVRGYGPVKAQAEAAAATRRAELLAQFRSGQPPLQQAAE